MKQSTFFITLMSAGLVCLLSFQNCSPMESKSVPQIRVIETTSELPPVVTPEPEPIVEPPPVVVADFGPRFNLDNVNNDLSVEYDLFQGDAIYYETKYRSSLMLTLVKLYAMDNMYKISVSGDDCNIDKALEFDDLLEFANLLPQFGLNVADKMAGENMTPDCAYPRLGIDGANSDYEVYFSMKECVPEGKTYSLEANPIVPPWFEAAIDKYCSSN